MASTPKTVIATRILPLVITLLGGVTGFIYTGCGLFTSTTDGSRDESRRVAYGYEMYPVPNEIDRPGVIFRIDDEGRRFDVMTLEIPNVTVGDCGADQISGTRTGTAGLALNLLGLRVGQTTLGASASNKISYQLGLNGARCMTTYDLYVDPAIRSVRDELIDNMKNPERAGQTYYIIREIINARGLNYAFDRNILVTSNVQAQLDSLVSVNPSINYNVDNKLSISYNRSTPLNVFYKVEELYLRPSSTGVEAIARDNVSIYRGTGNYLYTVH